MICGLLGEKLGHSYSPEIHKALGEYSYTLFEKKPDELKQFLQSGAFTGINVTIPYKSAVIPYCNELSPIAAKLGAVNVIVRKQDGTLVGHNSDYFGFETLLNRSGLQVSGKKVLVLGSGGASKVAVAVLEGHNANVVVISRNGDCNYGNLHLHQDAAVIVNTTPVGMYPNTGIAPLSLDAFPHLEGVLDAIYNPARTQLLIEAQKRGLVAMNGLWMLVAQAKEAAEWFTGSKIPDSRIDEIHRALKQKMANIVLIGMPGSGKTTVGKLLAEETEKRLVDADEAFAEEYGMSAARVIETQGEPAFRKLESQILATLGKESGLVIATGGGCVTVPENKWLLSQNGSLFWIQRNLDFLATEGRPLSQNGNLQAMYQARMPLYREFADHAVDNNGLPQAAVARIRKLWEDAE